jgi:hypothetical protein
MKKKTVSYSHHALLPLEAKSIRSDEISFETHVAASASDYAFVLIRTAASVFLRHLPKYVGCIQAWIHA